ncbi:MAG: adenosylcobinamide amidohydrolase [Bacillota bacterium]
MIKQNPLHIHELKLQLNCHQDAILITAADQLKAVSSALVGGGFHNCKYIVNRQVTLDYNHPEPSLEMITYLEKLGMDVPLTIGMMTAANISDYEMVSIARKDLYVVTIATAGITNTLAAGSLYTWEDYHVGTINTITVTNAKLADQAYINAVMTATEAKTLALVDLEIRSYIDHLSLASGTTTDALVIASTCTGKECPYAGTSTDIGQLIGYTVKNSVKKAIETYLRKQLK